MRLPAGSFRELHWHTSDEWSMMLTGKAHVSVMDTSGKMFINDGASAISGISLRGCCTPSRGSARAGAEFLLVFNDGLCSEDDTFLFSETLAHTPPPEVISRNMGW